MGCVQEDLLNGCGWRGLLVLILLLWLPVGANAANGAVRVLTLNDAIGPASVEYVVDGLAKAAGKHAQLVVIILDTPGGLESSMRVIVQAILASPVPVASFVLPSGARAASAGAYILYASHIAAMAPSTHLGAATPVQLGAQPTAGDPTDTLTRKQVSDAAAFMRGLAQLRGRNADWAEQAVRDAASLTDSEALSSKVIEYQAKDLDDLLGQLDGKRLIINAHEVQLHTANALIVQDDPDWRISLLTLITNPNVTLILIVVGVFGLLVEFFNPGSAAGGIIGSICLLLALYALQLLPVNYVGVSLIMLGVTLMVAEAFLPSFGAIGFGGVASFITGAMLLMSTDAPGFTIGLPLIFSVAAISAVCLIGLAGAMLKSRQRQVVSGDAGLVGSSTKITALQTDNPLGGWVQLQGEHWQVLSSAPLRTGQRVRVVARRGVILDVMPAPETPQRGD
ncbi:nodulation protein NfeD [Pseudomonas sp. CCI3.2]|uniref:NfeD family protein n=1 Tax=unclassified Pseudomonas TaxID=196821 RepID=UPI002AC93B1E|nr:MULTISPECIES: nodulation protein NfeD [unclassified Pseudomonas]MEB0080270.1 nodulation protein NfeD [Pseudomonas sp. MH10out]MEB0094157.1 nodulation protein NfeD [Pseudomonas sp. CCI4.2]MEB0103376.1 nodulation protein NfeD [Pseudomonas sp. CCI3.2]MEB0132731.1 nodulation protein NfeD [Pseudomonas sp. CCI2.4]MEB0159752.1 nodulation protein NfeD [Pseudomonas sp. AH2 (2023)]